MKYDELLKTLGEFGRYQRLRWFLVCLVSITSAFHSMNMVFVGPVPDHYCHVADPPQEWENLTDTQVLNISIPCDDDSDPCDDPNECNMYNISDIDWSEGNYSTWIEEDRTTHECTDGWWYSQEYYKSTIVSEWDLVCDKDWVTSTASTIFFFGRLVGAIVSGQLSDKFGRRPVFFVCVGCQAVVGIAAAASPWVEMFLVMYFLQGFFQVSVYLSSYVLGMELVGPNYRKWTGMGVNIFYAFGQMLLTLIAFLIREWRWIEVAISLPPLLFFSYWVLPESIRWLLVNGKKEEAEKILVNTAKTNRKELPENVIDEIELEDIGSKTYTVVDCLRKWSYAKLSLNIWFGWMVNALVYYGLNLNTSNLHGDPYVNFFLAAVVEIPGVVVALLLLDRVGRRWLMFVFMLIAGVFCLATAFVPVPEYAWLATTFSLVGKFAITASYAIIYLMAAEIFPTVVRNNGMGMASACARVGGMIAPQLLYLANVWEPFPLVVFGALSIIDGGLCLLLPETKGHAMPQNFADMEDEFIKGGDSPNIDESAVEHDNLGYKTDSSVPEDNKDQSNEQDTCDNLESTSSHGDDNIILSSEEAQKNRVISEHSEPGEIHRELEQTRL